jgi:hypothetical protein
MSTEKAFAPRIHTQPIEMGAPGACHQTNSQPSLQTPCRNGACGRHREGLVLQCLGAYAQNGVIVVTLDAIETEASRRHSEGDLPP